MKVNKTSYIPKREMFSVFTKYLYLSQHYSQVFIALEKSKMRRKTEIHSRINFSLIRCLILGYD